VTERVLRRWQAAALADYEGATGNGGADRRQDYLVTATPGSGKTAFALELAARLSAARVVDRVVVVCPTDHLRTQWAGSAAASGLMLDPTLTNAVGPVRPDFQGYVTTYAQVAGHPRLHRARVEARRTLVVLDEVHHAGDGLAWGEAVAEAFDPAARRVCLTGTPFRTRPDERIPFVRYDPEPDGTLRSHADVSYGYREALADGVVRPVVFAAYTGVARWVDSAGQVVAASLSEPLSRQTEAQAWRTALDPGGAWVPHVVAAMDERISHLRAAGMPDAAGLVLASDQQDARAYAAVVRRVTGVRPVLVTSDDPRASRRIEEFRDSDARIAVCVRMISEGVDLPRVACLAWLTSYRTPLFFAQAVGRVLRARTRRESATVFLPAVRPLLVLAAEMEAERNHALAAPPPTPDGLDALPAAATEGDSARWQALSAEAEFAHLLHSGRAVLAAEPDAYAGDDGFLGLPGLLSPEQTATLLSRRDAEHRRRALAAGADRPDRPPSSPTAGPQSWDSLARLRREVNALVGQVAARSGCGFATVHGRLRAAVPGPPSAAAGAEVLARRRDHLISLL
jgi:superfamily II DNA or RNA helicase